MQILRLPPATWAGLYKSGTYLFCLADLHEVGIDDLSDVWTVCNRRQLSAPIACKGLHMRRRASYDRGTVQNHFWPTMAEGTSFWTEELANTWYLASIIASFWFFDHFFFVTDLGHRIDCSSLKGDLNLKRSFFLKSRFLEWDILLIV